MFWAEAAQDVLVKHGERRNILLYLPMAVWQCSVRWSHTNLLRSILFGGLTRNVCHDMVHIHPAILKEGFGHQGVLVGEKSHPTEQTAYN